MNPERNRQSVISFYELTFNACRCAEAARKYLGDSYTEHNPKIAPGVKAFVDHFDRLAQEHPGKKVHLERTVAEGNFVVVHCRQEWPGACDRAGVDIFRLDDSGKIVEHWDVTQDVPETSMNACTMF